jgi:glycosyltransferase involved in cell wall biosynthesis
MGSEVMIDIAVLVPCYNEEQTIAKVIADFRESLATTQYSFEIYVYDNNSTDFTFEVALNAGAIVRKELTQGKGAVVRSQFRDIEAKCYIMVDGDNTYDAKDCPKIAKEVIENRTDMVVMNRFGEYFKQNKKVINSFGNVLMQKLVNFLFAKSGRKIGDILTGYRGFSPKFAKLFPALSDGFETETEMSVFALVNKMKIVELESIYQDRPIGSFSKLNGFNDGLKVIRAVWNFIRYYRPLSFFSLISGVFGIVALVAILIPVIEFFETGLVTRFPTLIVGGSLLVISLLSMAVGLITDLINRKALEQNQVLYKMLK